MKKTSLELSIYWFHLDLNSAIDLLMKIETSRRVVRTTDEKRSIFEAFVLRICALWESLVEELFIGCLNKDTSKFVETTGFNLPKHITKDMSKAVLLGMNYLDFKSIGNLKSISRKILADNCNPFIFISQANASKIDDFFKIRNYLSHYSHAATRSLHNMYRNRYKMRKFVEPGVFLLARDSTQGIVRMGVYINTFKAMVREMEAFLGIEV